MSEAAEILVIFLSVALAVFLVLGIVVLSILIKVLNSIKRLSYKAEEVGDVIEESVRSISGLRFLSSVVELFNKFLSNRSHKR